jgi:circadian clock protein KaiB
VKTNKASRATKALEKALATRPTGLRRAEVALASAEPTAQPGSATQAGKYVLRLFVAGATARSRQAVLRVRQLCEAELKDNCELEVIDIYQQPHLARDNQIVATPTLIKEFPRPVRRFIGNLTNIAGLFGELDLVIKGEVVV